MGNATAISKENNVRPQTAQVIPFRFEAKPVGAVLIAGDPWFIASDVCQALELSGRSRDFLRMLDDDEKGMQVVHTPGGYQQVQVVNESGLYSLIFKSRKAEAKRFKKWVTAEVLPAIREHGRYEDTNNSMGTLLGKTIGTDAAHMLGALIKGKVTKVPAEFHRQATAKIWSQTHTAFGVRSAADIPASQLDAARNFIAAYALEGEWLAKEEAPGTFQITDFQAAQIRHLLHSVAWVGCRWQQGIGKGVAGLNPALYGATVEHMQSMSRAASALDAELKDMLTEIERRQGLGGLRPQQVSARGLAA